MRVVVCTMYSPSHQELADVSYPNLVEYCDRHKYQFHIINVENDKWEYKKHEAFKRIFDKGNADIIWYKDIDSIITNMSIPITDFITDKHSFFITRDYTELNGGSVIIKNNDDGEWFNEIILGEIDNFENEQNAYNHFYQNQYIKAIVKEIPQYSINAYKYELYPEIGKLTKKQGQWDENALLLHTPALPMQRRIEILKNAKITR